jgi:hypothetical protein
MRTSTLILCAGLLASCSSSSSSPVTKGADFDWPSGVGNLPAAEPVLFRPSAATTVAQATIGQGGGTIEGTMGTPLEGVVVTFPAQALSAPTTFTLGTVSGTFENDTKGELTNPVLSLESGGQTSFAQPVTVTFRYSDPTKIPIPYYIDQQGRFELVQPLPLDRVGQRGGFQTWHASNYTWSNKDPNTPTPPVFNGFRPEGDGFVFSNTIKDDYVPYGRCWGISSFTKWYKQTQGSGLASLFTDPVPTKTRKKVSLSGQEIIATRAQISVGIYHTPTLGVSQTEAILAVQDALLKGAPAVMIGLISPKGDGHAVLAIGYSDNQIAVYDSNWPKQYKAIDYKFDSKNDATVSYGNYAAFDIWGSGEAPKTEPFETMLRDAKAQFSAENQTKIEITSHHSDQDVDAQDIVIEGKVHSGEVAISEIEVKAINLGLEESEPQTLTLDPGQEEFSLPVKLFAGMNVLVFTTRGYVNWGQGLVEIPNNYDGHVSTEEPFVLNWSQQSKPESRLSVKYSRVEIMGDSRTDTSVELNSLFAYTVNSSLRATINTTSYVYPFQNCTGYGGCVLVHGQTYAGTISSDWIPVNITTYHQDRYQRDTSTGEWKLSSTSDASNSVVNCEWIGLYIFVEPGSTTGNYRYRLALTRAGNIRCPNMQNQLPQLGRSLEMTDGTAEACESPPRIQPATIEPWIEKPTGSLTLSLSGSVDCSDGSTKTTETANIDVTLVPCNGAPCLTR